jgi:hypothetical protein
MKNLHKELKRWTAVAVFGAAILLLCGCHTLYEDGGYYGYGPSYYDPWYPRHYYYYDPYCDPYPGYRSGGGLRATVSRDEPRKPPGISPVPVPPRR